MRKALVVLSLLYAGCNTFHLLESSLEYPEVIDAVLNSPKTNYLYMCANPDFSGTHIFSSSYSEHSAVARQYQRALNQRKVK